MARKFKTNVPVIHVKSGARGTVVSQDGDKVTYLREDGSTSTVKVDSLMDVTKWEAQQAKAAKKAAKDKEDAERKAARAATRRERQKSDKAGYVVSGVLEYKPDRYIPRDGIKTAAGNKIKDIGDEAADEMAGKSFSEMVAIVARATGRTKSELEAKYANRNPGMQRMTLGNILRAANRAKAEGREYGKKAKAKAEGKAKPAKAAAKKATKSRKAKAVSQVEAAA